jgi:2-succinyl-6-hydroxy-2,4-cyclohexadiene-1-carboxylate synthase
MHPLVAHGLSGRLITPDLIGHGRSPAPADVAAYRVDSQVAQLDHLLTANACDAVDVIGYSMGARLALSFAVARPARIRRLVLISGRAGIADAALRAQRIEADERLAGQIEAEGVEAFARRWGRLPIFATQPADVRAAQHAIRCTHHAAGLANSLRGFGAGAMPPLHEQLARVSMPVCLIAGGLDEKFVGLAHAMNRRLPHARVHVIDGVGHAVHLEAPDRVARLINASVER